jgi:hypothetical protein
LGTAKIAEFLNFAIISGDFLENRINPACFVNSGGYRFTDLQIYGFTDLNTIALNL